MHTEIYRQMRELLVTDRVPDYLDGQSREMLARARAAALEVGLSKSNVLVRGKRVYWFPWLGTRGRLTLTVLAKQSRIPVREESLCLCIETSPEQFREFLQKIMERAVEPADLAGLLKDKLRERFDSFLGERLLDLANADRRLAVAEAVEAATDALHQSQP